MTVAPRVPTTTNKGGWGVAGVIAVQIAVVGNKETATPYVLRGAYRERKVYTPFLQSNNQGVSPFGSAVQGVGLRHLLYNFREKPTPTSHGGGVASETKVSSCRAVYWWLPFGRRGGAETRSEGVEGRTDRAAVYL